MEKTKEILQEELTELNDLIARMHQKLGEAVEEEADDVIEINSEIGGLYLKQQHIIQKINELNI